MSTTATKSRDYRSSTAAAASNTDGLVNPNSPTKTTKFAAIGRRMSSISFTSQTSQSPSTQFHERDIIPVPVLVAGKNTRANADEDPALVTEEERRQYQRHQQQQQQGFMGKMMKMVFPGSGSGAGSAKERQGRLRVVYMPRGDYRRYFAEDERGNYMGTEPWRSWSDEELDDAFGQYTEESY